MKPAIGYVCAAIFSLLALVDCILSLTLPLSSCSASSSLGLFVVSLTSAASIGAFAYFFSRNDEKRLLYAIASVMCVTIASSFFCLGLWFAQPCKSEPIPIILCINFILLFCASIAFGFLGLRTHEKVVRALQSIPPAEAIEFE